MLKNWLYDWGGLNDVLFHLINAHHVQWLDRFMLALSWAGDHDRFPIYASGFALASWWGVSRDPLAPLTRAWVMALAAFSIGYLLDGALVVGLKTTLDFPRPPAVFAPDHLIVVGAAELRHSFPSGHASFAALLATALWPLAAGLAARCALILYVVGVCISRPYLGFHFPADVLIGSLLAVLVVLSVRTTLTRILPARS